MKTKVLIVVVCVLIISCGFFGSRMPERNGVYYKPSRGEYIRLELNEGRPDSSEFENFIQVGKTPSFLFWEPFIRIELVLLVNLSTRSQHNFVYTTGNNNSIEVSVDEPLSDGVYCFGQGDPLAAPTQIRHWCFIVGDPVIEAN
jgi:hypothetical protein